MNEAIAWRRMSGLWIFGRPYKSGVLPAELYNLEYSCEEIAPDLFRDLNRSFMHLSSAGAGFLGSTL